MNAPRFLDEQGNQFLDKHHPEKIISIEGIRFYTPLSYKGTLQHLAIRRIEFLEDGKQKVFIAPPEQFSVALRYWRTETWLERLFCYGLYLIACGWLCVFYRKEQRKGDQEGVKPCPAPSGDLESRSQRFGVSCLPEPGGGRLNVGYWFWGGSAACLGCSLKWRDCPTRPASARKTSEWPCGSGAERSAHRTLLWCRQRERCTCRDQSG